MAFRGWPIEAVEFYEGLLADNSKTYWTAHRSTYDNDVLRPMMELIAEVAGEVGEGKIFRPYRDVRFSADKTPYKTHIGALFEHGAYVQLGADGLAAGRGVWHLEGDELKRYRAAVDDEMSGKELVRIVAALGKQGIEVMSRDVLKSAPRGFDKDHPRADLLRRKGLAAWQSWPVAPWLGTAKAKDRVVGLWRAAEPLHDWLAQHT
ncbi:MAG TPA: DUF2461 domain-containing protein [Mycobacteriales bacterium]|nr:DUF2461 domain-containing protein [Mycobacteriales bacterium]